MKKGIIIGLIVIITGVVAVFLLAKKDSGEQFDWTTKLIDRGDIKNEVTATGSLQAVTDIEVGTQVSGKIKEIFVDFNSKVKKGQVIARLDTTMLAAQAFDAQTTVNRMQIQLRQKEREYKRTKELYAQKVMAQVDYENALDAYETAKANLLSAEAQLNRAKTNLGYATITSPINGIVISRNVEVGQTVAASFNSPVLFQIVNDLTKMQVEADVDEADIGQVKVGQEVSFTVDAYPDDKFTGTVRQVRFQPVVISNVVNYITIIDVPNPDMKLMPGMTASLSIYVKNRDNVLRIPPNALTFNPPESFMKHYYDDLPDSVKQQQDKRLQRVRERMKAMGMSDQEIDQRVKQFQQSMRNGGQGFARSSGNKTKNKYGKIWVLENNTIRPVRVRVGLSDGLHVEISGRNIKEGMKVVTGYKIMTTTNDNTSQSLKRSPFLPKFGRRHH